MSDGLFDELRCALPEGWLPQAPELASDQLALVRAPVAAGFASTLSFRSASAVSGESPGECAQRVLVEIVDGLMISETDPLLIDLGVAAHPLGPAPHAVVAARVGRSVVTTAIWTVPFGSGAIAILGAADADHQPFDGARFAEAFVSLRVGDAAGCVPLPVSDAPDVGAPERRLGLRVEGPLGWQRESSPVGELVLRASSAAPTSPSLTAIWRPALVGMSDEDRHAAHVADAAMFLTDLEPEWWGVIAVAGGSGLGTAATYRQGEVAMRAILATVATDDVGSLAVMGLCELDNAGAAAEIEAVIAAIEVVA